MDSGVITREMALIKGKEYVVLFVIESSWIYEDFTGQTSTSFGNGDGKWEWEMENRPRNSRVHEPLLKSRVYPVQMFLITPPSNLESALCIKKKAFFIHNVLPAVAS
jgi:hypothetical protein